MQQRTATTGPVRSSVVVMLTTSTSIALASGRPTATAGTAGGQYAVSRASASVPFPPFLRNSFCKVATLEKALKGKVKYGPVVLD